jgi:hypothetical protein
MIATYWVEKESGAGFSLWPFVQARSMLLGKAQITSTEEVA